MLLPTENNILRSQLDRWFARVEVQPHIIAEFDDTALLKEFGEDGLGVFPIPSVIEAEVRKKFGVRKIGTAPVIERIYAISLERRVRHPAILAICEFARAHLFGKS